MSSKKNYSEDLKKSVLKWLDDGNTMTSAKRQFGVPHQTISFWNKKRTKYGTADSRRKTGRPRKTTKRDDKMIVREANKNPRLTAVEIVRDFNENREDKISVSTVKRRLYTGGLFGRRPSKKPLISKKNRMARLKFAKDHLHWDIKEWSKILWSDESKFNLFSSDGIRYIRRPKGKKYDIKYQVPTIKHGGGNVMVWGCFSRDGVGPLHKIDGIMDRFVYADILKNNMLPHAKSKMPRGWTFQQDNDPKHTSKHVKEYMNKAKIRLFEWPSQSPDLNPIEHLWEELERRIRSATYRNTNQLWEALQTEWAKIPLERLVKLVDSMQSRCRAVIAAKGFATKY